MGILSGNPKDEPMHYGEVYMVWTYLHGELALRTCNQTLLNHTGDKDLRDYIKDKLESSQEVIEELTALLKANGVALPPSPPERADADLESIPAGARFTDMEVAATQAKDNAAGLVMCSKIMGQCVREDIAALFGKYHTKAAGYGLRLLRMMKEKGWLVPPPLHVNHQE
ncbi:DUF3231 family protein [Tumebacillus sp. DT12]|uniref:DUF3231 family protein n=1 Tax=Tumebacillus lacus TaxID=2995335 RepID=A0ABT3X2E1_9BACL|nr:DUF3231 family protein [Tumebacillus lacus]MCX7571080.1 DUF3231 family protein [Tumebacillus lacus]